MSAFNGSGQFVITGTGLPFTTGTVISSTVVNQLNTDLAAGLSNCICKDGQSTPTNNIPMGGFKLTGLGAATTLGDALSYGQPANVSSLTVTGPATIGGYGAGVGRNRLINGDFRIDQRNAGAALTTTAGGQYCVDRWRCMLSLGNKFSVQGVSGDYRFATLGGSSHLLKITSLSAYATLSSDYFAVDQLIEGLNVPDLAYGNASAQSLSLSFLFQADITATYYVSLVNVTNSWTYNLSFSATAGTPQRVIFTIPGDTAHAISGDNTAALVVRFNIGSGGVQTPNAWITGNLFNGPIGGGILATNGANMYIGDIQLELAPPGATPAVPLATPFERRQFGQELLLCQRYFQTSYPLGIVPGDGAAGSTVGNVAAYTTAAARVLTQFSPPMRATPGMVAYRGTNAGNNGVWNFYYPTSSAWVAGTGMSLTPNSAGGFTGQVNTNAGNFTLGLSYLIDGGWIASAEL